MKLKKSSSVWDRHHGASCNDYEQTKKIMRWSSFETIITTGVQPAIAMTSIVTLPLLFIVVIFKIGSLMPLLRRWNFPLSEIPGPRIASWTRLWWLKIVYSKKADTELVRLHKKYGRSISHTSLLSVSPYYRLGPIVRIGPNTIIVSDPETTRKILAVGSKCTRGPWFDSLRLDPDKTTVVSERDVKKHQEFRYVLSAGVSSVCSSLWKKADFISYLVKISLTLKQLLMSTFKCGSVISIPNSRGLIIKLWK